ncbi:hypothetical protein VTL71DRAFT_5909 [Oculimacula yallundae]|uniref:Uncharacterized protein n=1 Tax=Oculimacula yallundae TaxID=86028 RepID=A0ABR4BZU5_9HELO
MSPQNYPPSKKPSIKNPFINNGKKLTKRPPHPSTNDAGVVPTNKVLPSRSAKSRIPLSIPPRSSSLQFRAPAIDKAVISAPIPIPGGVELSSRTFQRARDLPFPRSLPPAPPSPAPSVDEFLYTSPTTAETATATARLVAALHTSILSVPESTHTKHISALQKLLCTIAQNPELITQSSSDFQSTALEYLSNVAENDKIKITCIREDTCVCQDTDESERDDRDERLKALSEQEKHVLDSWCQDRVCWCGEQKEEDREWDIEEVLRRKKRTERECAGIWEWLDVMGKEEGNEDDGAEAEDDLEEDLAELQWRGEMVQWDRRERGNVREDVMGQEKKVLEQELNRSVNRMELAWWERMSRYGSGNGGVRGRLRGNRARQEARAKQQEEIVEQESQKQKEDPERQVLQDEIIQPDREELQEQRPQHISSFSRPRLLTPVSTRQSPITSQEKQREKEQALGPANQRENDEEATEQILAQPDPQEINIELQQQQPEPEATTQRSSSPAADSDGSEASFWTADSFWTSVNDQAEEPAPKVICRGLSYYSRTESNVNLRSFTPSVFELSPASSKETLAREAREETREPRDGSAYDENGFLIASPGEISARRQSEPLGERIVSHDEANNNTNSNLAIINTKRNTPSPVSTTIPILKHPRHVSFAEGTSSPPLSRHASTSSVGHGALRQKFSLRSKSLSAISTPPLTRSEPYLHDYTYVPPADAHLRSEKYALGDTGTGSRATSSYMPPQRPLEGWSHHSVSVVDRRYTRVGQGGGEDQSCKGSGGIGVAM